MTRNGRRSPGTRSMVWTIGHSTRSISALVELLRANGIVHVADVRTLPRSRRHPHFNRDRLAAALELHRIAYTHFPELGGLREPLPESPNRFWTNPGFRGFADYMGTPDFAAGLARLMALAADTRVAAMSAEAVPASCHRSLIADALVARGVAVEHILGPGSRKAHELGREARVEDGCLVYPGPGAQSDLDLGRR